MSNAQAMAIVYAMPGTCGVKNCELPRPKCRASPVTGRRRPWNPPVLLWARRAAAGRERQNMGAGNGLMMYGECDDAQKRRTGSRARMHIGERTTSSGAARLSYYEKSQRLLNACNIGERQGGYLAARLGIW